MDILIGVGVALARMLLTIAAGTASPVGLAPPVSGHPTPAEIRTAVSQAEASPALWATVNICDSRRYPHTLGVRGQMPALGFASWMSMAIQVNYYSQAKRRFEPVPHASTLVRLGRLSSGLQQGGWALTFRPHAGLLLEAEVLFVWRRSGQLLGQTRRPTTVGHPDADFGSPPHYSAQRCRIS